MSYSVTMSTKGRVTIPKEIRKILKLKGGEKLQIELEKNEKEIRVKQFAISEIT